MTPKQRVLKEFPNAYCGRERNRKGKIIGKYLIWDDGSNPVFRDGHDSAIKAWKDLARLLEVNGNKDKM